MIPLDTTRKAARALAETTLTNTGSYTLVTSGALRNISGRSPVALILSKSMGVTEDARDMFALPWVIMVRIYVLCPSGSEETAEDQLDDLVSAAMVALRNAGFWVGVSDATPEGAPLRVIDGKDYRVEQLILSAEDYQ